MTAVLLAGRLPADDMDPSGHYGGWFTPAGTDAGRPGLPQRFATTLESRISPPLAVGRRLSAAAGGERSC